MGATPPSHTLKDIEEDGTSPSVTTHVQTKEMEDAQRSAQRAIAATPLRPKVKLVTGAQLSEAGS